MCRYTILRVLQSCITKGVCGHAPNVKYDGATTTRDSAPQRFADCCPYFINLTATVTVNVYICTSSGYTCFFGISNTE